MTIVCINRVLVRKYTFVMKLNYMWVSDAMVAISDHSTA